MTTNSHGFESKKQKILHDLSLPDGEYADLSPKGSVDEGIRDLIRDINRIPGLVTTSSCAGRISVFLEGRREGEGRANSKSSVYRFEGPASESDKDGNRPGQRQQFTPAGGKGSGRWLFVSHDPITDLSTEATWLHDLFNLIPGDGKVDVNHPDGLRLVRFHFEPMVSCFISASPSFRVVSVKLLSKKEWRYH
jgi:tRNA wybutosine-synthesizing protein 3